MENLQSIETERVLSLRKVEALIGLRKTAIYGAIKTDGFPPPVKLTARKSGWLVSEVHAWIDRKRQERDQLFESVDAPPPELLRRLPLENGIDTNVEESSNDR